jgi:hypothetical protein
MRRAVTVVLVAGDCAIQAVEVIRQMTGIKDT